ncbi:MAG TPA: 1-acyl-sn-glycerol-3-phosphate acyltransferase [Gemmatimonadetes bacterium]|nr:1-acyl-sn-glycerol-3-phosphate acyltransferase [Gemmatimonadota bacterium]
MLRSAWILGVGGIVTFWYASRVVLLSFYRDRAALCGRCYSVARAWSRAILKLSGTSVRVEGVENLALDGAFIMVSNHESWFDVWALAGSLPVDTRFAIKKELERIPIFGRAWRACGHISIDRSNQAVAIDSMSEAGKLIKAEGLHMLFFAEGTRCSDGALHPFKKGPFVIAIEGGVPVVPIALVGSRSIMPKGSFRIRPGTITVRIGEQIAVEGMVHDDRDQLRDSVREAVARLRGGWGRTCCLPGEPPLDDVPEASSSNTP